MRPYEAEDVFRALLGCCRRDDQVEFQWTFARRRHVVQLDEHCQSSCPAGRYTLATPHLFSHQVRYTREKFRVCFARKSSDLCGKPLV